MTLGIQDVNQIQSQNQAYSRQRISAFPIEIREQDNMSIHSMDDRASIPEQATPQPPEQQNTPQPQTLVLPQPLQPILQQQQQTIQASVIFLIARSIQAENWGLLLPECENLLYFLDMSSKLYNVIFYGILMT